MINPIPGFGDTFEIGWMIIQVDLIGYHPYRVDLSLRPLGRGLLEGDDVLRAICKSIVALDLRARDAKDRSLPYPILAL